MSTKMEVVELRSLDPDGSSMTINIHHTQEEIIVITSKTSLYDVFQELTLLSFAPMKLTHESIIGALLSHEEDTSHFCGSLIPLPVLSNMVDRVLEADSIHIFLQVASCLCNLVVQEKPKDVGSMISSGRNALRKSVELPANAIWTLLILSEVLGAEMVMVDCKQKLAKLLASQNISNNSNNISHLPASVVEGIEKSYVKEMESKFVAHLLLYGVGSPKKISEMNFSPAQSISRNSNNASSYSNFQPQASTVFQRSVAQHDKKEDPSDASVTSTSHNTYESVESSGFFSDDEDGNKSHEKNVKNHMLNRTSVRKVSHSFQSPNGQTDSESSFRDEDNNISRRPQAHFKTHEQHQAFRTKQIPGFSQTDDMSILSSIHSIDSWGMNTDGLIHVKHHIARNIPKTQQSKSAEFTSPHTFSKYSSDRDQHDEPMHISDIHISKSAHQTSLQQYQQSVWNQHKTQALPERLHIQPQRSRSQNVGQSDQDFVQNNVQNQSSSTNLHRTNRSESRTPSPRWNLSTRTESRSNSPSGNQSKSKSLSPEDLKLSRDIAMLRLREAKIKSELEASKHSAEKALRDNKLKSLELKAAVLRMGSSSSGSKRAQTPSKQHSKPRPSSAPRTRSNLSQSIDLDSKSRALEREFEIAEEARFRALQRVKEKRREIAIQEQRQKEEKKSKQAEVWKARDEKIAKFIEQQHNRSPISEEFLSTKVSPTIKPNSTNNSIPNKVPFSNTANRAVAKSQPSPTLTNIQVKSATPTVPDDLELNAPLSPYQGVYSKEALEAVGLGYSPTLIQTSSPINIQPKINESTKFDQYRAQQQAAAEGFEASISPSPQDLQPKVHKRTVELLPPPPPPKDIVPPAPVEVIDFNIIRCWDLQDCLGGTNPYVLINIPSFGKASTPCVYNSNQPYFGCILSLNYPLKRSGNDDDLVNYDGVDSTVVQVFVYNKNHSISDEMIAFGERDLQTILSMKHSFIMDLYDKDQNPAGYVEIAARYRN